MQELELLLSFCKASLVSGQNTYNAPGFVKECHVIFLKKFIVKYQDLKDKYPVSTSQIVQEDVSSRC